MKLCDYCGRDNDEAAVHCRECGKEIQAPQAAPTANLKSLLRRPSGLVSLLALVVVMQGAFRLVLTPSDPNLGDGDYERVEAAFYLWFSLGIGIVLFAYGYYLRKKESDGDVA